jgi:hypothetical protein
MATLPVGLEGIGCAGIDPNAADLGAIADLQAALDWPGIGDDVRDAFFSLLGLPTRLRDVAFVPAASFSLCVDNTVVAIAVAVAATGTVPAVPADQPAAHRPISPIESGKLYSFRRICRLRCGLTPGDPSTASIASPTTPVVGTSGGLASPSPGAPSNPQTVKLSQLVDPRLDICVQQLDGITIRHMFESYRKRFGDLPEDTIEPSADQISAIRQLLVTDQLPYADFSILSPRGAQMLENVTYISFRLLPDNSWQRKELPGPSCFAAWWISWKVLRCLFLLLDAADSETLDNYAEHIRALDAKYGRECWFITYNGERRMRRERFERIRRDCELDHSDALLEGRPSTFDPQRPWNSVFMRARKDRDYWNDTVRDNALLFLNQSRTAEQSVDDGTIMHLAPAGNVEPPRSKVQDASGRGPGLPAHKRQVPEAFGDSSEQDASGGYVKNKKGLSLCTRFQDGTCQSSGGQCKQGAHQCRLCLQCHPASKCAYASSSGLPPPPPPQGGKGGRGGKSNKKGRHGKKGK